MTGDDSSGGEVVFTAAQEGFGDVHGKVSRARKR